MSSLTLPSHRWRCAELSPQWFVLYTISLDDTILFHPFTPSVNHPFNKYLWSSHYVFCSIPDSGYRMENWTKFLLANVYGWYTNKQLKTLGQVVIIPVSKKKAGQGTNGDRACPLLRWHFHNNMSKMKKTTRYFLMKEHFRQMEQQLEKLELEVCLAHPRNRKETSVVEVE